MRGVEVAELVLLAAAFAVGLLLAAALLQQFCRRRLLLLGTTTNKSSSSELRPPHPSTSRPTKQTCRRRLTFLLMLCSGLRRRARVEPATANPAEASPAAAVEVDDVARWRERWFGPVSRALYTIDEEDEGEERPQSEPETPFYTPPVSPAAAASSVEAAATIPRAFSRS